MPVFIPLYQVVRLTGNIACMVGFALGLPMIWYKPKYMQAWRGLSGLSGVAVRVVFMLNAFGCYRISVHVKHLNFK